MSNYQYSKYLGSILPILYEAKNVLVLAVGGGNDSVSTLLLQKQLQNSFGYQPEKVTVVAVLPDCLDYHDLEPTVHPLLGIITGNTTRSVQGKIMTAFPERILSQNKKTIPSLPIETVYGISMREGSVGVAQALIHLVRQENFDLIMAIDVGGDFIAVERNIEVLSPMMDGYMLYALKELEKVNTTIPVIYSVFGLGTDGESTPHMLRCALEHIPEHYQGQFNQFAVRDVIQFYRDTVEPNRYSRTADFTIREIENKPHDNPAKFRGRFHVKTSPEQSSSVHYGFFEHQQDPEFFGKYYLFGDISKVHNIFSQPCVNGIQWFLNVQNQATKINHELNGQAYSDLGAILKDTDFNGVSLLFGTPSKKFDSPTQAKIASDIYVALQNQVYNVALVYQEQAKELSPDLCGVNVEQDLTLVGVNKDLITKLAEKLNML